MDVGTGNPNTPAVPALSGYDALWTKLTDLFKEEFGSRATGIRYRFEPAALRFFSPLFQNENDKVPNPLLAHVRIFLLADYYDIVPLSDLSFGEMGKTFPRRYKDPNSFEYFWQMEYVVELIEFCWDDARPAKLRDAVVRSILPTLADKCRLSRVVKHPSELS